MIRDAWILWKVFKRRYPKGLSRSDIVLDIGSGHRPHPRANILLEKFVEGSVQRGGSVVRWGLPLIVGDITSLPFLDYSIDYIICSHVLEHMEKPIQLEKALSELMRVGRRGYIETPSYVFEKLLGAPYHHWYVRREGKRIIFTHKRNYGEHDDLMRVFLPLHRDSKTFFRLLHENFDRFFVSLEWNNKIEYLIDGDPEEEKDAIGRDYPSDLASGFHHLGEKLQHEHRIRMVVKRAIHTIVSGKGSVDLCRILACPVCKRNLPWHYNATILPCAHCRLEFPVRNRIPIMLPDQAAKM